MFDGVFKDYNSLFHSNWALDGVTSYSLSSAEMYFNGTKFVNETSGKAGAFAIKEMTFLSLFNTTLEVEFY